MCLLEEGRNKPSTSVVVKRSDIPTEFQHNVEMYGSDGDNGDEEVVVDLGEPVRVRKVCYASLFANVQWTSEWTWMIVVQLL